jgi:hypothetical protein
MRRRALLVQANDGREREGETGARKTQLGLRRGRSIRNRTCTAYWPRVLLRSLLTVELVDPRKTKSGLSFPFLL